MLQELRDKSQGWIAKVIIGVIVLLFALTGFDAIFRAVSHDQELATVNGDAITKAEFSNLLEQQQTTLRMQQGDSYDDSPEAAKKLGNDVLEGLINYHLLLQSAHSAGFIFNSPDVIVQSIHSSPEFLDDQGRFDRSLFEDRIRSLGYYSEQQFLSDTMDQLLINQLQSGITRTTFATAENINHLVKLFKQTRDFTYYPVKALSIKTISDEQIKAWYDEHKDSLKTPEQVILQYVELKKTDFLDKAVVSPDDITKLYEKRITELNALGNRQRIAHILISVDGSETEQQAKKQVNEIENELKQGQDFAMLAKKYSKDSGTADKGGDLGFITNNDLPDPAFAQALKDLKNVNDISEPIRSRFGWHIIKLLAVQKPTIPSFDSMKDQLVDAIKQQKAEDLYIAQQRKLDDAAFENFDNLAQVAKDFNLPLQTTEAFGRKTGESAITTNKKVLQAVFSDSLLNNKENSTVINISPATSVVVRVKEHFLPEVMTYEQAVPEIKRQLQIAAAKSLGEKMIADIKAGKVKPNTDWRDVTASSNPLLLSLDKDAILKAEANIINQAFKMSKPIDGQSTVSGVELKNGDYAVIVLKAVNELEGNLSDKDKEIYQNLVVAMMANTQWAAFQNDTRAKAEIKYIKQD